MTENEEFPYLKKPIFAEILCNKQSFTTHIPFVFQKEP